MKKFLAISVSLAAALFTLPSAASAVPSAFPANLILDAVADAADGAGHRGKGFVSRRSVNVLRGSGLAVRQRNFIRQRAVRRDHVVVLNQLGSYGYGGAVNLAAYSYNAGAYNRAFAVDDCQQQPDITYVPPQQQFEVLPPPQRVEAPCGQQAFQQQVYQQPARIVYLQATLVSSCQQNVQFGRSYSARAVGGSCGGVQSFGLNYGQQFNAGGCGIVGAALSFVGRRGY